MTKTQPLDQSNQPESKLDSDIQRKNALLAFRTITTMLSLIQSRKKPTTDRYIKPTHPELSVKLKVLDALAAITIRQYGVAAVIAKAEAFGTIQVLVSVTFLKRHKAVLTVPQSSSTKMADFFKRFKPSVLKGDWGILYTRNPRRDGKTPMDSLDGDNHPVIINPVDMVPKHLRGKKGSDLLTTFLTHDW